MRTKAACRAQVAATSFFGWKLLLCFLARLKPISDDLVLALHFCEFFLGLFVPCESSLNVALPLQRAIFPMRHGHSPLKGSDKISGSSAARKPHELMRFELNPFPRLETGHGSCDLGTDQGAGSREGFSEIRRLPRAIG